MAVRTIEWPHVAGDRISGTIARWVTAALLAAFAASAPTVAVDVYGDPVYPARLSVTDPTKNAVGVGTPLYNGMELCEPFAINNAEKIRAGVYLWVPDDFAPDQSSLELRIRRETDDSGNVPGPVVDGTAVTLSGSLSSSPFTR